ncbi:MAG: ABC transporter permease [Candidatus Zixiibacteriota bacterium]|nr:MAG: ABC transporter permease [candidate division Zixibacteria bacterium]
MIQTILALMKKELYQVIRDRNMLRLIFISPIIQLLVLGYAINTDVKKIDTAVYDFDRSSLSREYIKAKTAGDYFVISSENPTVLDAELGFKENLYTAALIIPNDFSENFTKKKPVEVGLLIDGSNANSASITSGYAEMIAMQFNRRQLAIPEPIVMRQQMLYNPESESVYFMVPGIVAVLITMITAMLSSMAIVREREIGTLEQLMVTPITVPALIIGKTIPFAILGFLEMSIALLFGVLWFGIPFAGSWTLLYGLTFIYLFTTLGVGLFISTVTQTQQQAMFYTWFFSIFAILTSGFFSPIVNMPEAVQYITYLNPLRYYMIIVRGIMMKGATVEALYPEIIAMIIFGIVIFTSSWLRYSKRVS